MFAEFFYRCNTGRAKKFLCFTALAVAFVWLVTYNQSTAYFNHYDYFNSLYGIENSTAKAENSCAIIYLAHAARINELAKSLNLLFRNFNTRYGYPVIVFYDDKYGRDLFDTNKVLSQLTISPADRTLISFEYLRFKFPTGISEANRSQVLVWPHAFPSYNHMIAFWAYHVFHHPRVRNLEYFWRLDTDGYVFEPVQLNLFAMMRDKGFRYGYRKQEWDPDWAVKGMTLFLKQYIHHNNVTVAQPNKLSRYLHAKREPTWFPTYYNNFEIMHVPTFQRSDIQAFRQAFLDTMRIYTHRWGDAPQRYAMVNLFLREDEVHFVCECPYEHQHVRSFGICRVGLGSLWIVLFIFVLGFCFVAGSFKVMSLMS